MSNPVCKRSCGVVGRGRGQCRILLSTTAWGVCLRTKAGLYPSTALRRQVYSNSIGEQDVLHILVLNFKHRVTLVLDDNSTWLHGCEAPIKASQINELVTIITIDLN